MPDWWQITNHRYDEPPEDPDIEDEDEHNRDRAIDELILREAAFPEAVARAMIMGAADERAVTPSQYQAIQKARLAFAETLQEQVGADELLPLAVMAAAIGFVDIVRAAAGAPEIVAFINSEIAGAGLALVAHRAPPAPRNGPSR